MDDNSREHDLLLMQRSWQVQFLQVHHFGQIPQRFNDLSFSPRLCALMHNDLLDETQSQSANEIPSQGIVSQIIGFFRDLIPVVVMSLAIIIPVRYFLVQPFYVKGASMEPNFHDEEYLIIDELSYRFRQPERGETVVFRYPQDHRQYFIKRVIGLPGERVVVRDGKVTVYNDEHPQGETLNETGYLGTLHTTGTRDTTLGPDEFFLLGDNRGVSLDSRSFGPVHKSLIVGRAWVRGWPPDRAGVIDSPLPTFELAQ